MKHLITLIEIFVFTFLSSQLSGQDRLSARQIADLSYEVTRVAGMEATATMTIIDDKGRERVRKTAQVMKLYDNGETEKRLVRFLAPADVKGTGLLTFDYKTKNDDIWLYLPALRKTRRIVSSEKSKSFMGSEFSYADMTPPTLDDFKFDLLGDADVRRTACWKIEMTAVDDDIADENGFSKRISFIGKQDYMIRKAIYYDIDGELHKELNVFEIKEIDPQNHKFRAMHLEMENKQNGRKSILKMEKVVFNPNVKDEYFSVRYLERE
ncbi:MAG TPA: outer membrane lipoprotein-sorting protein [bacterium]|nr:outer membrane lipoprotein-sorting protein [bacterium]